MATAGTGPWALLVAANLKHGSAVPWAVPPAALYLWIFWRYARGAGQPRSTADSRRATSRVNRLPDDVWGMALLAGAVGIVAILLLQNVLGRMVTLPQQQDIDLQGLLADVDLFLDTVVLAQLPAEEADQQRMPPRPGFPRRLRRGLRSSGRHGNRVRAIGKGTTRDAGSLSAAANQAQEKALMAGQQHPTEKAFDQPDPRGIVKVLPRPPAGDRDPPCCRRATCCLERCKSLTAYRVRVGPVAQEQNRHIRLATVDRAS